MYAYSYMHTYIYGYIGMVGGFCRRQDPYIYYVYMHTYQFMQALTTLPVVEV